MSIQHYTNSSKAHDHDTTMPLLTAMWNEFREISKKKPDSAVSASKLRIANRLIERVRTILVDEDSIDFLDIFEEDDVPQASDVTLVLSQYVASMKAFKDKHHGWNGGSHDWFVRDVDSEK